ncbi:Deoxyguanosinetriphosphate triphosphohydrolase [Rickettsiales bacterium Ac37b]|nr:Deoxyguanosinetriphosphate triphosphohydrolase [Rickettsiales bacterium Ac37b]
MPINTIGLKVLLKSFASNSEFSKGRLYLENPPEFLNNFQYDRGRLVNTTAFRRLEYKTQVFVNLEGDHYRTRLTHTLEVSHIARNISRILGLCEDLTEVIALAHDLGHPPFGHAGEEALNQAMSLFGGFNHNIHTFKILTELERCYAEFDGLNLTWEVLEGIAKHNGPIKNFDQNNLIIQYSRKHDLSLDKFSSLEAQVASLADDIAYTSHDIEDGIRAGFCDIEDFYQLPIVGNIFSEVAKNLHITEKRRIVYESIRRFTNVIIMDLIKHTNSNIKLFHIRDIQDVYNAPQYIVEFSDEIKHCHLTLKEFLFKNVYRHPEINIMSYKAKKVVSGLFEIFFNNPDCLPLEWQNKCDFNNKLQVADTISNFIAGMTDRFAIKEYNKFFNQ